MARSGSITRVHTFRSGQGVKTRKVLHWGRREEVQDTSGPTTYIRLAEISSRRRGKVVRSVHVAWEADDTEVPSRVRCDRSRSFDSNGRTQDDRHDGPKRLVGNVLGAEVVGGGVECASDPVSGWAGHTTALEVREQF